jgi:hypothetical protein
MPVIGQELSPHLDVTVLDASQLPVDIRPARVALGAGELPVQESSVGFVFEVVKPGVWG